MTHRTPPRQPNPAFEQARTLAPLAAQLDDYNRSLRQNRPAMADAYQVLIDRLVRTGAGGGAPREGESLPPFLLPDETGRLVSSSDLLAQGPLVVSFNRGNWCPFCWLELAALNDSLAAITAKGGQVLSITPEIATYSRQLKDQLGLRFPILTDMDNAYALELGLTVALSPDIKTAILSLGADLGVFQRNESWFVPIPATLAVRRDGRIARAYVNPEFRQRLDPKELLGCLD